MGEEPNFAAAYRSGNWTGQRGRPSFGAALLARFDLQGMLLGVGGRLGFQPVAGGLTGGSALAFWRGDTCDFSTSANDNYGCTREPHWLDDTDRDRFGSSSTLWFMDAQALLEATIFLTAARRAAINLTVGVGKPVFSASLGLAVYLGPTLGASR